MWTKLHTKIDIGINEFKDESLELAYIVITTKEEIN